MAAVAHTARDAMRAASEAATTESPVDLVLLDIGLPDASGITLASGLSGLRPAPDIIAITSERDLEMVRAAVGHGALAYLECRLHSAEEAGDHTIFIAEVEDVVVREGEPLWRSLSRWP